MENHLQVHIALGGTDHLVGRLWTRSAKGKESASFEYVQAWLEDPLHFALEPALALGKGPQHTLAGRSLFGAIGDSAPDRWGRVLIQREERRAARAEQRIARTLTEADYLLAVADQTRQGALRFVREEGGPFLADKDARHVPPLVQLPALLNAAMAVGTDKESDADLKLLLAPGSSLGGARPKASVLDKDGHLLIAKFPQKDDTVSIPVWEALALKLANVAGIPTPEWSLRTIADRPVLLLKRFERDAARRIPFLSGMSMLGAMDRETHSYMELADALRQHGAQVEADCAQLWRRIVFNILISNTDDHLRNHGFLLQTGKGWILSPAYDLNPVPVELKERALSLTIDEADNTASLDLALLVAGHFGLKAHRAREIALEVGTAVQSWRREAVGVGLSRAEIEAMASAFEHDDLKAALAAHSG